MKYGRTINQYKYKMQKRPGDNLWPRDGNLGDPIQSLAVENIYAKAGINELLHINRDDIKFFDGENCQLVMQGWFGDYADNFPLPWSENIKPIFIGFHLSTINHTRERFTREKIYEKMKPYEPIGCRDRNTRDFLRKLGVNAYFSGCMTLTFEQRKEEPQNGKTFIVDLDKRASDRLPEDIKRNGDFSITHFYYWNEYPVSKKGAEEFEIYAKNVLQRYKTEAKLIITSKIHVAMPCIAMGIPVIFITDSPENERFDVLSGIIPIYSYKDIKYINWKPELADISKLKRAIEKNAIAAIKGQAQAETVAELEKISNELKPISFLPRYARFKRKISACKKIFNF